ncbi:MAG: 50S ribosomal protein L22 [Candidatus Yanofskybacteria bacterium GW2011_GWF1_44_227]|uniref:Large ribosomal subunit protein uL22 n=1 Tax=Candidatus Yanofskybacteria bacterium GW2011_GWE2_40_11 TaxID=1619033 RepID=A0A0G0QRT7_9BACT|nr:MAG: 50S ribosomal protein L22 [Candidatus Yanofskybacteria bacterium GW2011_GWE1_40_10]KKR40081.1 MAG: 50S ribosomal protein L22 [Candidatus Yanofskybacteria bacterium GW2011_GWE2_40_11]KKT15068.1 MAG: 50S ribosomal protein L22 [Candidatus Yanofskybacteria bacterium GW2011_GWF2_43_596]KKT52855.1 MAG: 50S ribosomal protein L22 [Candidatus Yanofskybacteria bacterium GW2011_GWF1_44_227]OGN35646.1 MAG: 50S ribosomal protein L22 [Candidatus Yanofskybacteria bacterium RIFOXYA1_FULL_44_17]OGN3668
MAEVKAKLNGLRMAPRKVRAITQLLRGKDALFAINQLEFLIRKPANPVKKLLESAIASAENDFQLVKENLFIKEFRVDEGVKLRRFKPKGFGRAALIQKKTSHVVLVLSERVAGLKSVNVAKDDESKKAKVSKVKEDKASSKLEDKKPSIKKEIGAKKDGFVKKIFQRKAV